MTKLQIFFVGTLTAFGALFVEILASIIAPEILSRENIFPLESALLLAIFAEEILKLIFFGKIFLRIKDKSNFFLPAIFFGSGFAIVEIFLNILANPIFHSELFFSYLGLFLIHILTLSIYSFYFFHQEKVYTFKIILLFALGLFIHFIFNFFVFYEISPILLDIALLFLLIIPAKIGFLAKNKKLN
ncbi:MAG: hypothetical protein COX29_00030 [Candidatus Moranbacteria bacterium CG23_combo_of_CG06-09_8_20_14_all_35_22]|nr:MAG: hypothetical protein COX29_00030 [Candidatus Moranbacteria bacterium CG23_combo_of_CG06-09_8_20_14_all_35_22]